MDNITYVIVKRGDDLSLEKFDASAMDDCGNGFDFCAYGLPLRASGHNVSSFRVRKITARVLNTKSLFINGKRATLPNSVYDADSPGFSGDVSITQLGTVKTSIDCPWKIHGSDALPTQVISVSMYGNYEV